jgi:hypothetical protein
VFVDDGIDLNIDADSYWTGPGDMPVLTFVVNGEQLAPPKSVASFLYWTYVKEITDAD